MQVKQGGQHSRSVFCLFFCHFFLVGIHACCYFYYLRRKFVFSMKRKEYNSTMATDYKKCSVANFAPACFVIDIYFL
jgi:hypothetical protein